MYIYEGLKTITANSKVPDFFYLRFILTILNTILSNCLELATTIISGTIFWRKKLYCGCRQSHNLAISPDVSKILASVSEA